MSEGKQHKIIIDIAREGKRLCFLDFETKSLIYFYDFPFRKFEARDITAALGVYLNICKVLPNIILTDNSILFDCNFTTHCINNNIIHEKIKPYSSVKI